MKNAVTRASFSNLTPLLKARKVGWTIPAVPSRVITADKGYCGWRTRISVYSSGISLLAGFKRWESKDGVTAAIGSRVRVNLFDLKPHQIGRARTLHRFQTV